jgi:riboflavin kinase/FMN adenylyltransferase
MILLDKFSEIKDELNITIGTFDAIHKGHLKIINKLISFNEKKVVLSFFPPPFIYFKKESKVLFLPEEKLEILSKYNIDYLFSIPFNDYIKDLKPDEFINLLTKYLNIKRIIVGKNFKFGKDRKGDTEILKEICDEKGIDLIIIEEEKFDGEKISSSKIRKLIEKGEIEKANQFLTYPYFIKTKFKNNELIINKLKLLPPDGKYLTKINNKEIQIEILNQKILLNTLQENFDNIYFIKKV